MAAERKGPDKDTRSAESVPTLSQFNKYLRFHPTEDVTTSQAALELVVAFNASNLDPTESPNLEVPAVDDTSCLAFQLTHCLSKRTAAPALILLTAFKIVLRKDSNRASFPDTSLKPLVQALQTPLSMRCATEASNAILNLCYDERNVSRLLDLGGIPPIVRYLSTPNVALQASACGALQSISYQARGRSSVRDCGALPMLCELLNSEAAQVVLRAVGALHNMSSDPLCIPMIRDAGGIAPLVRLLRRPSPSVCGSAAGALQNLSREPKVRQLIRDSDAVPALIDLLVGSDPASQICAAGALLNLLGPVLRGSEAVDNPERIALRKLLADGIALGAIADTLREPTPAAALKVLEQLPSKQ